MRILVPEFQAKNVLAALRTLGRAGHDITLAMPVPKREGRLRRLFKSRYVNHVYFIRSPHIAPDEYVKDLLALAHQKHFDVLLPFTHGAVLPVSYHKAELSKYFQIPFPDYVVLEKAHDKLKTLRLARSLDIPIPVTFAPRSGAELSKLALYLTYPCLVKARQGCGVGTTIRFAQNFEELVAGYEAIHNQPSHPPVNDYTYPVIQEYVPGRLYDAVFLYADGECRAAMTQERVKTYPLQGGPGVVSRTTRDPHLRELGQRLLDALQWHGPAQVEFRLDPRDNQYKLMEINPKLWGTLPLAIAAGIDFSRMACELAYHDDVVPSFDYQVGLTHRFLFPGEVQTLIQNPSWTHWREFLRFRRRNTRYDWDWCDPLPDVYRAVASLYTFIFDRRKVLPARLDLNAQALANAPAHQPDFGFQLAEA